MILENYKLSASDLLNLIAIRNHIIVVMNDTSVCSREEYRSLNSIRIELDKKFVKTLNKFNVADLFPVKEHGSSDQLSLPFNKEKKSKNNSKKKQS